jgi:hypothetical protein
VTVKTSEVKRMSSYNAPWEGGANRLQVASIIALAGALRKAMAMNGDARLASEVYLDMPNSAGYNASGEGL